MPHSTFHLCIFFQTHHLDSVSSRQGRYISQDRQDYAAVTTLKLQWLNVTQVISDCAPCAAPVAHTPEPHWWSLNHLQHWWSPQQGGRSTDKCHTSSSQQRHIPRQPQRYSELVTWPLLISSKQGNAPYHVPGGERRETQVH